VEPPLGTVIAHFSMYEKHFFPFMRGLLQLNDVVYYLSVVYLALLASVRAIQNERWR